MVCSDYNKMSSFENIRRAYRWLQSNPDPTYKQYFRDSYTAYAASSQHNLKRIQRKIKKEIFEAHDATKIYTPKPSGILRPLTLITVDDQIAYQACVNIIAEKLKSRVRARYLKNVYGNLYAGKTSIFFYLDWKKCYRAYSAAVKECIEEDYDYVANFDLTAFYDSIDHHVLKDCLLDIGVDMDLVEFLLSCLKTWTPNLGASGSRVIIQGHGIPQGPLSSGLLSEVVLKHLDDCALKRIRRSTKYLRYVDDIKVLSKDEAGLRRKLVLLDLASKEIGLFPQSDKINIRRVEKPSDEIKSISQPVEPSVFPAVDQEKLRKRVLELTRRGTVDKQCSTRFKYLLNKLLPSHQLNNRLISIIKNHPEYHAQISAYFEKYEKLPKKASEAIFSFLKGDEIYHAVQANMLFAVIDSMEEPYRSRCVNHCYNRIFNPPNYLPLLQPSYKAALIAWLQKNNKLTYAEFHSIVTGNNEWWVSKKILQYLTLDQFGRASYQEILNECIRLDNTEIARAAALKIADDDLLVEKPERDINEDARSLLFTAGKIRRIGPLKSQIGNSLSYVLDGRIDQIEWQRLFNRKRYNAEQLAFVIKRSYEADINNCLVTLDSFCDLVWEMLWNKYSPGRNYGNYGGMLESRLLTNEFPNAASSFTRLHELRLLSITAHPRQRRTGGPTRLLKHRDLFTIRPSMRLAFNEIISKVAV